MSGYRGAYAGGRPPLTTPRRFNTGSYYGPMLFGADAGIALTESWEYAVRFEVGETTTFDRIGLEITTLAASNVVRLVIRYDNHNLPGNLLLDAGTIDASTTGYKEITISQQLTVGQWWLSAILQGGTGAQVRHRTTDPFIGQSINTTQNAASWARTAGGSGAATATFSGTPFTNNAGPKILLRAA